MGGKTNARKVWHRDDIGLIQKGTKEDEEEHAITHMKICLGSKVLLAGPRASTGTRLKSFVEDFLEESIKDKVQINVDTIFCDKWTGSLTVMADSVETLKTVRQQIGSRSVELAGETKKLEYRMMTGDPQWEA